MFRPLRWPVLLLLAAVLVAGAGYALQHRHRAVGPDPDPALLHPAFGPADYPAALAGLDARISGARADLAGAPGEWLRMEALARALLARYRLAGSYADADEAGRLLDRAMAEAPDPAGPSLTRASAALLLHDLTAASAALDRFDRQANEPPAEERADALGMRGDIAFQHGDTAAAERFYGEARGLADTPGMRLRAAILLARTGRLEDARDLIDGALLVPGQQPATLADIALQRASLAYAMGDVPAAGRWIAAANRLFPGRWLTRAWAAQHKAVTGDRAGAIRDYAALAEETGKPEVMDALAHLLRLEGRGPESRAWAARSAAIWGQLVARQPRAYAQHAAEHELALGSPQKALALARIDVAARPYGQALVLLARAQTLSGDPAGALASLDRAQQQGWQTALLHLERAAALELLGRGEEAAAARDEASRRNPLALAPAMLAIWFGHE